jgi:hypothetical protein
MRAKSRSNRGVLGGVASAILIVCGCSGVDGGAVELSWKLRPASSALEDKFVDCKSGKVGTNPIAAIRLEWTVEQQTDHEEWPCDDSHGVTGFVLPAGSALFSVSPVCEFGPAIQTSYIAPAVEQRAVISGDTVSLGAVELVVQVTDCGVQDCICE